MSAGNDANNTTKRSLPSWMSSRDVENKSQGKTPDKTAERNEGEASKQAKGHGRNHGNSASKETNSGKRIAASRSGTTNFSKLMEGVVFVLSGFVNPERSTLRSQALEMGADWQPDWNSDCTLLICAFPNTPKFRQVEADCGTIVSKEWISECYMKKKLVDIESYLMHAGKPWRRSNISHEAGNDSETPMPKKPYKQVEIHPKPTASASRKNGDSKTTEENFSHSTVKKWVTADLNKTILWLESQEEKPEPSEIKNIAAEGILTCLQDAIDSLEQTQDIGQVTEQWRFIPRVVEELAKIAKDSSASHSKKDLLGQAVAYKRIYEEELKSLNDSDLEKRKLKNGKNKRGKDKTKDLSGNDTAYDSDETIEMTEEEIDAAYRNLVSVNSTNV